MRIAPEAALDDGLLDVVIIAKMARLTLLRRLPTVFRGKHLKYKAVEVLRCATVEIAASRPFTLYADGDPVAELPVTVGVLPGAVRVLVPA